MMLSFAVFELSVFVIILISLFLLGNINAIGPEQYLIPSGWY